MTLLVRDEADVLDAQIASHLDVGVDFVLAIHHESQGGTSDVLGDDMSSGRLAR
jgi:hypothetical protein